MPVMFRFRITSSIIGTENRHYPHQPTRELRLHPSRSIGRCSIAEDFDSSSKGQMPVRWNLVLLLFKFSSCPKDLRERHLGPEHFGKAQISFYFPKEAVLQVIVGQNVVYERRLMSNS